MDFRPFFGDIPNPAHVSLHEWDIRRLAEELFLELYFKCNKKRVSQNHPTEMNSDELFNLSTVKE